MNFKSIGFIINLMSEPTDTVSLLKFFDLSEEEGKLYLILLAHGFLPVLTVSRLSKIPRTKTYRLLEKLQKLQLVETKLDSRGMKFGASHPSQFNQLLSQKRHQLDLLQQTLPNLIAQLNSQILPHSTSASKVLYYQGLEGLKQVSYNITKADKLLRVYEMEHLSDFLPADFSEDIRQKLVDHQITTLDLTNKTHFGNFTKVTEMIQKYSQYRFISPKNMTINFEVLIYNDVYATYTYKSDPIFCVEIHNAQLAAMQKQIFDFIWSTATPLKFTSTSGAAKIS